MGPDTHINQKIFDLEVRHSLGLIDPKFSEGLKYKTQKNILLKSLSDQTQIQKLQDKFQLSDTELDILFLAIIPDLSPQISGVIQSSNYANQGRVTGALLEQYIDGFDIEILNPDQPLRRHKLVKLSSDGRLFEKKLMVQPNVMSYLRGRPRLSDDILRLSSRRTAPDLLLGEAAAIKIGQVYYQAHNRKEAVIFHYAGRDPYGFSSSAAAAMIAINKSLLEIRSLFLHNNMSDVSDLAQSLRRDLVLTDSVALISIDKEGNTEHWFPEFIEKLDLPLFILGKSLPKPLQYKSVSLSVEHSNKDERYPAWISRSGNQAENISKTLQNFDLTSSTIQNCLNSVRYGMSENLTLAVRENLAGSMGYLAQKIDLKANWENLILPNSQKQSLEQMSSFLKHRNQVNSDWGFGKYSSRGLGMAALFYGPSGTGKTTAAEALIREMNDSQGHSTELYRVNISSLVSKYIGETSKNIDAVFKAGSKIGAALLFDEAEGLFAKRTNSNRDSIDKHSNAELGFLLQCLESYQGIAILTTNMRDLIDEAFMRRFRFAIEFPFPEKRLRKQIWETAIPDETPKDHINFEALARPPLSGGNIRSIAINAAYMAASSETDLTMSHLANAMRLEYSKLDRPAPDGELRRWCA